MLRTAPACACVNLREGKHDRWVVESQLRIPLRGPFWTTVEYRFNGY